MLSREIVRCRTRETKSRRKKGWASVFPFFLPAFITIQFFLIINISIQNRSSSNLQSFLLPSSPSTPRGAGSRPPSPESLLHPGALFVASFLVGQNKMHSSYRLQPISKHGLGMHIGIHFTFQNSGCFLAPFISLSLCTYQMIPLPTAIRMLLTLPLSCSPTYLSYRPSQFGSHFIGYFGWFSPLPSVLCSAAIVDLISTLQAVIQSNWTSRTLLP